MTKSLLIDKDPETWETIEFLRKEDDGFFGINDKTLNARDKYGYNVLHHAVYSNNTTVVTNLLKLKDLEFENRDAQGNTALHLAAHAGSLEMVELLMKEIDIRANREGETPLHIAAASGKEECVEHFMNHSSEDITGNKQERTGYSLHDGPL